MGKVISLKLQIENITVAILLLGEPVPQGGRLGVGY